MESTGDNRSTSRNRPSSRPNTPLRPNSRSSLRDSQGHGASGSSEFPLDSLQSAFGDLADSMADLEANFMHLQIMHESLSRFNESFASFLYGINMNAFCVDFHEAPISESFKRARQSDGHPGNAAPSENHPRQMDDDASFMTNDPSLIDNTSSSSRTASKFATPSVVPRSLSGLNNRGGSGGRGGHETVGRGGIPRGTGRAPRGSGLARAKPRGAR